MKKNEKAGDFVMNTQNMITDKEQKVEDDIPTLKSKIFELQKTLHAMELELEKMEKKAKGLKRYSIEWVKYYYSYGTEEIEATTEEEAIQIAKDEVCGYSGHMEGDFDKNEFVSLGEVKE